MAQNGMSDLTFEGLMCNIAQLNFNAMRIVSRIEDSSIPMV